MAPVAGHKISSQCHHGTEAKAAATRARFIQCV
jgi:hypothetical protein